MAYLPIDLGQRAWVGVGGCGRGLVCAGDGGGLAGAFRFEKTVTSQGGRYQTVANIAYGSVVEEARGLIGRVVFTRAKNGPTARIKAIVRNPRTLEQRQVRSYLSRASKAFKNLTSAQAAAWNAFGATQVRSNPVTGETYTLSGISAFVELAAKFLQVQPNGTIPLAPPTSEFPGDSVTLTATAGTGQILLSASGANALGVTTEILLQPLPSRNRKPNPKGYDSEVFRAFATGSLDQVVTVPAGFYAAAYRFVRIATGQASDLVTIPVVTVNLSLEQGDAPASSAGKSRRKAA